SSTSAVGGATVRVLLTPPDAVSGGAGPARGGRRAVSRRCGAWRNSTRPMVAYAVRSRQFDIRRRSTRGPRMTVRIRTRRTRCVETSVRSGGGCDPRRKFAGERRERQGPMAKHLVVELPQIEPASVPSLDLGAQSFDFA